MNKIATLVTATALLAGPAFAQSTTETAEEILNESADNVLEEIDSDEPTGAVDCADPAAEVSNESDDTTIDDVECTTEADGTNAAGEEEFEELEEEDDEGVEQSDG